MTLGERRPSAEAEDQLRREGVGGPARTRLAESIAEEFRVRVDEVRQTFDVRLEQERALHRMEMAEQRVRLLEGMVPLAAHEAVVGSYEASSAAALEEVAASSAAGLSAMTEDFFRRQEALRAQVGERDASLKRASDDLRGMSDSLAGLKRDVASLRAAVGSHASRAEESRRALALEIRANEVEPERLRADAAETGLSELRQAAHGWLSAAHALKLEAASEARAEGHAVGRAQGRLEGELKAEGETRVLRTELDAAREALSNRLALSRRERLALREEVAEARNDAVAMVAAVGKAGAAALTRCREAWLAEGRADGFAAGLAQGLAEGSAAGRSEGLAAGALDVGNARAEVEAAAAAATRAGEAEVKLREAFAAYVVSAHEQKLRAVAMEREASVEVARGLSGELEGARGVLAELLQDRISEMEARRDSALSDVAAAAAAANNKVPLTFRAIPPWMGATAAPAGVATDAVDLANTNAPFWQECGGGK